MLKKFEEWQITNELAMPDEVADLQVRGMVKNRLAQLFAELEKSGMNRGKAIKMLSLILGEFMQEYNIRQAGLRQAVKMASDPMQQNHEMN